VRSLKNTLIHFWLAFGQIPFLADILHTLRASVCFPRLRGRGVHRANIERYVSTVQYAISTAALLCMGGLVDGAPPTEPEASADADRVEALTERIDPLQDDWPTEVTSAIVGKRLASLAKLFSQDGLAKDGLASLVAPNARTTPLRPGNMVLRTVGGNVHARRATAEALAANLTESVASAIADLVAPFDRDGSSPRFKFKVVGITPTSAGRWTTEVRFEGFGQRAGAPYQQTAQWRVGWKESKQPEQPLIQSVRLLAFEDVSAARPLMSDCTDAVLANLSDDRLQWMRGAEYWHDRIDSVGERNYFGHNGIAIGDVNGDGLDDIYVAMGTGLPNKLLIQQEDSTVLDMAVKAGVAWLDDTKGVLLADMDNDGDQDLLCAIGPTIVLCKNDGAGRFTRFVSMRGPTPASFYSLSLADYDLDGDLDIFGCRYVKLGYGISIPMPFHDANNGPSNHLLRNDGNDRFVDVTAEVGLDANNRRFSLSAAWADYDGDGDPDLYVVNDFGRNNLYRNDRGTFVDVAAEAGAEDQAAGMGASWSDFDLDGDLDLYVSNMFSSAGRRIAYQPRFKVEAAADARAGIQRHSLGNSLLINQGDGTFRDGSDECGVRMGRWAWGARFVDLNNDGYDDLVVPNGFLTNTLEDDL